LKLSYGVRLECFFRFLDKAAIITEKDSESLHNPWRLSTVTQVEEVKFLLRVLPIFLSTILYTTCYSQLSTLFIEQAYYLDRHLGSFNIPPASIAVFESISVVFWVVVYDRLLVPFLRKRTGNQRGISELQRIGIGLFLSICAMIIAAVVEIERLRVVHDHGLTDDSTRTVPMSVFWEVPQYFVMGASEVFTYIGMMEFFYDQAPDAIRSIGSAITLLTWGLGYFIATALIKIVGSITTRGGKPGWIADNLNQGRVDLFYWTLAILAAVNLVVFILCALQYDYKVTQGPLRPASQANPEQQKHDQQEGVALKGTENTNPDSKAFT
jgi:peptide/histidine transporter 3/4